MLAVRGRSPPHRGRQRRLPPWPSGRTGWKRRSRRIARTEYDARWAFGPFVRRKRDGPPAEFRPDFGKGGGQCLGSDAPLAVRSDRGPDRGLRSQGFASTAGSPAVLLRHLRLEAGRRRSPIGPRRDRAEPPETVRAARRTVSLDPDSGADRYLRVPARCKPGQLFSPTARRSGGRRRTGNRFQAGQFTFGCAGREVAPGRPLHQTVFGRRGGRKYQKSGSVRDGLFGGLRCRGPSLGMASGPGFTCTAPFP